MISQSLIRSSYYKPCKTGELVQSSVFTINGNPYDTFITVPSPDDKHMYLLKGGFGTGYIANGPMQNWVMKFDVLKYSISSLNGGLTYSSTKTDTVPGIYPFYPSACEFSESGGNLYVVLYNNYNSIVLAYSRNLTNGELTLVSTSPQFSGLSQLNFLMLKSFGAYVIQPGLINIYSMNTTDGGLTSYPTTIVTNFSQPYAIIKAIISPDSKYMYVVRSNAGLNIFAFNLGNIQENTFIAVSLVDTVAPIDPSETLNDLVWSKKDNLVYAITTMDRVICYKWEYTTGRLIFKFVKQLTGGVGTTDTRLFISSSPGENLYRYYRYSGHITTFKRTKNSGEIEPLYTHNVLAHDILYFSKNSNFVYIRGGMTATSNILATYKRTACQVELATICHPISGEIFKNGVSQGVFVFSEQYQYNSIARFAAFTSNLNQYSKINIFFQYPSPGSANVIISISIEEGGVTTEIYPMCNTTTLASNSGGLINMYGNTVNIQWSEPRPLTY